MDHYCITSNERPGRSFFQGAQGGGAHSRGALIRGDHSFDDQIFKFITKYIHIFTLVSFKNYNFQQFQQFEKKT